MEELDRLLRDLICYVQTEDVVRRAEKPLTVWEVAYRTVRPVRDVKRALASLVAVGAVRAVPRTMTSS